MAIAQQLLDGAACLLPADGGAVESAATQLLIFAVEAIAVVSVMLLARSLRRRRALENASLEKPAVPAESLDSCRAKLDDLEEELASPLPWPPSAEASQPGAAFLDKAPLFADDEPWWPLEEADAAHSDACEPYGRVDQRLDWHAGAWWEDEAEGDLSPGRAATTPEPPLFETIEEAPDYGTTLEACVAAQDMESALQAVRAAQWRPPQGARGQAAILALIRWLAQRQDLEAALRLYEGVREAALPVDLPTFRVLLSAAVRGTDMPQAAELFRDLACAGHEPDLPTFSALVRGYCAAGDLEQAMMLFHVMRERNMVPDVQLFNALLDGCAWRNMAALTEEVMQDMDRVGVVPSNTTLSILIRSHGRSRDLTSAIAVFDDIPRRYGFEANPVAYGTLISVCIAGDRLDLALERFRQMGKAGVPPNARTYEALVTACLRHGDVEHAVGLIDDALSLSGNAAGTAPRAYLERKVIENTLTLIGRRRLACRLGVPLVERLQKAGVEISDSVAESIHRDAAAGIGLQPSKLEKRRLEHCTWRAAWPNVAVATAVAAAL